jgi:hypothetical protein
VGGVQVPCKSITITITTAKDGAPRERIRMTYEEFKAKYSFLFVEMSKYSIEEAGSSYFCEKLAELCDQFPKFEEAYDAEIEVAAYGK